jgi:hypothetical protein
LRIERHPFWSCWRVQCFPEARAQSA